MKAIWVMAITIKYLNEKESKIQNEILKNEQQLEVLTRDNNNALKQMEEPDIRLTEYEKEIKHLKKTNSLEIRTTIRRDLDIPGLKTLTI